MPAAIVNGETGLSARTKINAGFVDIKHSGADNALLRADGADSTLQSSGIICDDSDNLSAIGTIANTGNHTITNGNVIIGTDGKGIDFSATAGGGAASSLFDDYEEGTATITMRDATSGGNTGSTATAYYTKKGDEVTLHVAFTNMDTTGMTAGNILNFTGLPYTANANVGGMGSCMFDTIDIEAGYSHLTPFVSASQTYMRLMQTGDDVGFDNVIVSQITDDTSDLQITLVYKT